MNIKPQLFIGSSTEGLIIAQHLQSELQHDAEVVVWNQNIFEPGSGTLETLTNKCHGFDFAIMIISSDDQLITKEKTSFVPRDNVIFELGLFIGAIGRNRTYYLYNQTALPKLPSDLAGITGLTYIERYDGNLRAALGPACNIVRNQFEKLGGRYGRMSYAAIGSRGFSLSRKNPREAIKLCKKSIELNPDYDVPYFGIFDSLKHMGDYDEAMLVINEAIIRFPYHPNAIGRRGHLFWLQGNYGNALKDLNKAIELNSNLGELWFWRGRSLEELTDYHGAIESYNRALKLTIGGKIYEKSKIQIGIIEKKIIESEK